MNAGVACGFGVGGVWRWFWIGIEWEALNEYMTWNVWRGI